MRAARKKLRRARHAAINKPGPRARALAAAAPSDWTASNAPLEPTLQYLWSARTHVCMAREETYVCGRDWVALFMGVYLFWAAVFAASNLRASYYN